MRRPFFRGGLLAGALVLAAVPATAQLPPLDLPQASPAASVSQRIGLTDITITYHRPAVNNRKIWGELVPYDQVWRAGANENTTIELSSPATVGGKSVPAGTYGLHMLPGQKDWSVMLSSTNTAWGSFSYDEKEDALRVTVKPRPAEMQEALSYTFDDLHPDSTVVTMRWEKVAVPFQVKVDVPRATLDSLHQQLRGLQQYSWVSWNDAATWAIENKTAYEEALKWADTSIQNEERFENLDTKAQLLRLTGKNAEADAVQKQALAKAGPLQLHNYGRQLLAQKKTAEAVKIFETNARKNPTVWFVYMGLARGQSAAGRYPEAAKNAKEALARAPEAQKKYIQGLVDKLQAGKDINS